MRTRSITGSPRPKPVSRDVECKESFFMVNDVEREVKM